jgi:hypothetical protein
MLWKLTLKDPLNLVPPIDLNSFTDDGYQSVIIFPDIINSNAAGVPIFGGSYANYQLTWLINIAVSVDTALRIKNLFRLQFTRGYLILEDQFQELPPEPFPHSRSLISGTQRTIDDAVTGCGRIPVSMAIKSDLSGKTIGNRLGTNEPYQDIYLTLVENLSISV